MLKDVIDITYNFLTIPKVKYFEGTLSVLAVIKQYNMLLRKMIIDGGGQQKIQKLSVRHLALSLNCVLLIHQHFLPNIKKLYIETENNTNGFNILKLIDNTVLDLESDL